MKLFGWKNNSFKLFGVSVFRFQIRKDCLVLCFLDIPVWKKKTELSGLFQKVKENKKNDDNKKAIEETSIEDKIAEIKSKEN